MAEYPEMLNTVLDATNVRSLAEFYRSLLGLRYRPCALALGATVRYDRSDDEKEPSYVFADPAGHPFCILVG